MAGLSQLKDTRRTIDWEELPASVREVPDGFDPLADGVLMRHQAKWISIKTPIKAGEKGRRTGITFCEALDDTITAASQPDAEGDNVFYIGDTKEKGLEFIGYCAKFSRVIAEAQGQGISDIEEFLFADQEPNKDTKYITAYRIRFASGFQIVALSSRPANIRGLQGVVVIDEAAFHADVQGVLDAATALLIWGGKIRIISTHNGKNNPFNQLIRDIQTGLYGDEKDAVVFKVTFDDAVANGLYERVCLKRREKPTPEGKKRWYNRIRNAYGPRKAAMREELDAIPRDSGGMCIPGVWIDRAMPEKRPVLRMSLADDFYEQPDGERKKWCEAWIKANLEPLYGMLRDNLRHVAGMDFARHRHFSVITPLEIRQNLDRLAPFVIELQNVPIGQQMPVLWALNKNMPRWCGTAIDATGPGMGLAELTADHFGLTIIHQVDLSRSWYGQWMPKMTKGFEDGIYNLPRDADLEGDLRAVETIDGIQMVPKVLRKDLKEPDLYRHGDFAISLVLAEYAALNMAAEYAYHPVRENDRRDDDDDRPVKVTAGLGCGKGLW